MPAQCKSQKVCASIVDFDITHLNVGVHNAAHFPNLGKVLGSTNIALGKTVTSSGMYSGGPGSHASYLVDGHTNGGSFSWTACAHTAQQASWLKVDLGTTMVVGELQITGRNGYADQCSALTIRVGDSGTDSDGICASNVNAEGVDIVVACDPAQRTGRYITVYHSTWMGETSPLSLTCVADYLLLSTVLCELKAYELEGKPACTLHASGKKQSCPSQPE